MKTETELFLSAVSLVEIAKIPLARARECLPSANQVETRAVCELKSKTDRRCASKRVAASPALSRHCFATCRFAILVTPGSCTGHRVVIPFVVPPPVCHPLSPPSFCTPSYTGYRLILHRSVSADVYSFLLPFIAATRDDTASRLSAANCTAVNESFCAEN